MSQQIHLIECPACNHHISSEAQACPQCGHPHTRRFSEGIPIISGFTLLGAVTVCLILLGVQKAGEMRIDNTLVMVVGGAYYLLALQFFALGGIITLLRRIAAK